MLIRLIMHKAFAFLSRYYTRKFYIHMYYLELKKKKYKYFHVLNNGLHSRGILDFINNNFNQDEHCFLIPLLKNENVDLLQLPNVYKYPLVSIPVEQAEKIIFHGLFTRPFIDFLYERRQYLKKAYWFIWGGDLYTKDDKVSTYVKSNMKGILTAFDYDVYKEKFKENKCFDVTYPAKWPSEEDLNYTKEGNTVSILINNSADETTLEMMDILAKYKDEDIRICTVLSYITVGQNDVRLQIMQKGYELFGSKFQPLINFMPADEYTQFLNSIDIYISNQDRQQGNGNASYLLALGKKIFVKSDTSVYQRYQKEGIVYFDTYSIPELTFDEFKAYDEDVKQKSIEIMKVRSDVETKVKQWRDFFDAE